ncbi:hypothetical protein [Cylindrospermum stagnale]|uniref:hypothetical protein n=1 Tax=Cylindrospermum stagnale TaxID=142864 RepID=UPI00031A380B|nr:hypothetical protein [Cylindrospermum stagnale]
MFFVFFIPPERLPLEALEKPNSQPKITSTKEAKKIDIQNFPILKEVAASSGITLTAQANQPEQ